MNGIRLCITAMGDTLDDPVDPRFGRAGYFTIVDSSTMAFEAIRNMGVNALSKAGIRAVQTIKEKGVKVLITGNIGPNAFQVLNSSGIKIVTVASGTVNQVVEQFLSGELEETKRPTVCEYFGQRLNVVLGRGIGQEQNRRY